MTTMAVPVPVANRTPEIKANPRVTQSLQYMRLAHDSLTIAANPVYCTGQTVCSVFCSHTHI